MISDKINEIINEQINKEFFSGYLYLSMSAYLKELGLFGFSSWLKKQAKEEVEHGLKLFDYLIERNSFVTLKQKLLNLSLMELSQYLIKYLNMKNVSQNLS